MLRAKFIHDLWKTYLERPTYVHDFVINTKAFSLSITKNLIFDITRNYEDKNDLNCKMFSTYALALVVLQLVLPFSFSQSSPAKRGKLYIYNHELEYCLCDIKL